MKQIILKDGIVVCTTTIPYPENIIKSMKKAGYKIKTEDFDNGNVRYSKRLIT